MRKLASSLSQCLTAVIIAVCVSNDPCYGQSAEQKLGAEIARIEQELRQRSSQLTEIEAPPDRIQGPFGIFVSGSDKRGYRADDVARATSSVKYSLIASLDTPELAGIRSYVEKFFPTAEVEIMSTEAGVLATTQSSKRSIDTVLGFLNRLSRISKLSLDLAIGSTPDGAVFRMTPSGGGLTSEATTNGILANQYRGYYQYEVAKAGFKKVQGFLNLVDTDMHKLECSLHTLKSTDGPTPCVFR